jgi:arylsulfatase A-like enzyme
MPRIIKKILKVIAAALGLTILALLIYAAVKIYFFPQQDDAEHLTKKKSYLASIGRLATANKKPNIVLILFDDLGYGDIGAFGGGAINTPNMDRLAANGVKFNNYYAPAPNCTPSRAGMLTGRYPIHTTLSRVIFPHRSPMDLYQVLMGRNNRLPSDEILLPEILRSAGYATGMIGKWHLGDRAPSLPINFGFDEFFGALYSNDMQPFDIYQNTTVAQPSPIDQRQLTATYTREAIGFITRHKTQPFFLYMAHNFPHRPLHSSVDQQGKSAGGLYGDVVEDLDRSVGEVIAAMESMGIADNTLILVTSDNGPWFEGSPGNHRGRKNDTFEGGMAVPFIAYWPGMIHGETRQQLASGLDIVPTVLDLLGLPLPADRQIDGFSFKAALLDNEPARRQLLFYSDGDALFAVRDRRFKYHNRRMVGLGGIQSNKMDIGVPMGPWLFDLAQDPNESYDVSSKYPDDFANLQRQFDRQAEQLAVNPRGWLNASAPLPPHAAERQR